MLSVRIQELTSLLTGIGKKQSNILAAIVKSYCEENGVDITKYIKQRNNNCELNLEFASAELLDRIVLQIEILDAPFSPLTDHKR